MLLADARSRLRVDLSDVDATLLTGDVLDRSINRAVSDLSRFLPLDKILEVTLIFTVTDEAWTSAAAAATYVSLANKPVKFESEVVKNAAGTVCTRDTDYYMDYANGKITHISGGAIGNDEACTISYTKSEITLDINSLLSELIRVERVEYPVGDVPQSFVPFEIWKTLLTVKAGAMETQTALTEKEHVVVFYKAKHTGPTVAAEGSFPNFLDDTIILAASAYALFSLGIKYVGQAVTDFASARTALGNIAAIHTLIDVALDKVATEVGHADTALDKVATYLEDNTNEDAKSWLTKITTDIAALRTAIATAVTAANAYLDEVDTTDLVGAEALLELGDDKINTVNTGDRVPENYREYALARISTANARANAALSYIREADTRLSNLRSYIEQASGWNRIADAFINEAVQRLSSAGADIAEATGRTAEIDRYIGEADRYSALATQNLNLVERIKSEAVERRNEAWAIWRDPVQYIGLVAISPVRQPIK